MKSKTLFKLAACSAVALGIFGGVAHAVDFEAGIPQTINVTATVQNTITATVAAVVFDEIGAVRSGTPGDTATLALAPDGTQTPTPGTDARLVFGGTPDPGLIDITTAFASTPIFVTYSNAVNLTCGTCAGGNPALELIKVTDDLTTPTVLDIVTPGNNAQGTESTSAGGLLTINIGATIRTADGITPLAPYESGAYSGSFDAVVEY